MAQRSMPWDATGVGDGALTGYTEAQVEEFFRDLFTGDRYASEGVLAGIGSELAATATTNQVTVASGAGITYGKYYQNTAASAVAVTSPLAGTTGLRVNLRVDWAAQTSRAVVIKNTDGTSAAPALTQTAGTTFDVPVATGTITTGGTIALTDARDFCHYPTALIYRRQGGSASNWSTTGTTNYTPGEALIQCGAATFAFSSGTGTQAVTFPTAFSGAPVVLLTVYNGGSSTDRKLLATVEAVSASSVTIRVQESAGGSSSGTAEVFWLAIGPA